MRKIQLIVAALALIILSGCAGNQTDKLAFMKAFGDSVASCKGEAGCVASMNAALYTGAFSRGEDSTTSIIAAALPWGNLALEVFRTVYGGAGGSGQGFVLNRSNNNTFIGFNKASLKGGGSIYSPFDATNSVTRTQENMYNPINDRSVTDTR